MFTLSLWEILGRRIEPREVKIAVSVGMAEALHMEFQTGELSPKEWALAGELACNKTFPEEAREHSEKLSAVLA